MDKFWEILGFIGESFIWVLTFTAIVIAPTIIWWEKLSFFKWVGLCIVYWSLLGFAYHGYWLLYDTMMERWNLKQEGHTTNTPRYYRSFVLSILFMILGMSILIFSKLYFPSY
jgi:hypothetical protein